MRAGVAAARIAGVPSRGPRPFPRAEFDARLAALRSRMAEDGFGLPDLGAREHFLPHGPRPLGLFRPAYPGRSGRRRDGARHPRHGARDNRQPCPERPFRGSFGQREAAEPARRRSSDFGLAAHGSASRLGPRHGARHASSVRDACPQAEWVGCSGLVDGHRMVKSPAEQLSCARRRGCRTPAPRRRSPRSARARASARWRRNASAR